MRTSHTHPDLPELPTPYSAVIPHYVKCFTEYLRAAGYFCANNDKTDYQFDAPLTAWDDEGHKTEIDLFTTSPENLHFIGGPQ